MVGTILECLKKLSINTIGNECVCVCARASAICSGGEWVNVEILRVGGLWRVCKLHCGQEDGKEVMC